MSDIEIIKWMALATGVVLAFILVAHFVPISFSQSLCLAQENRRYDLVWQQTCAKDGLHPNCQLPKQQTDVMGWNDHIKRAEACK